MAADATSWEQLRPVLVESLPYNSHETRKRYVSSLADWALEGGNLSCLAVRVWRAYKNRELLEQILRERYLVACPVLGRFVSHVMCHLDPGETVENRILADFLNAEHSTYAEKTLVKLRITMRDLGFLRSMGRNTPPVANDTRLPGSAFLILLHHHLAVQSTTVPVSDILANPFWRHLGGRAEAEVRSALSLAAARDVIARYAAVDHLEQVTTRYSLEELLRRQVLL